MHNPSREFVEVRIGQLFHLNGNDYQKKSSRTARCLKRDCTFYIGKSEKVYVIAH